MLNAMIVFIGIVIGAIVGIVGTFLHAVAMIVMLPFALLRGRKRVVTLESPSTREEPPVEAIPTADDFRRELHRMMLEAQNAGREFILVNAGNLHIRVGGYPGNNHRMPNCCQVMRAQADAYDRVVEAPPSGFGASLTIRYRLPRRDWNDIPA